MSAIWCDKLQSATPSLSSVFRDGYQRRDFLSGGYHVPGELREQLSSYHSWEICVSKSRRTKRSIWEKAFAQEKHIINMLDESTFDLPS